MRLPKYLLLSLPLIAASCSGGGDDGSHDAASRLFAKSEHLLRTYIDSIENARDSATLQSVVHNFDGRITAVNYEFPPDTDLKMTEEENDSLIKLYQRMERVRQHRDSVVMHKIPNDSVKARTDSLQTGNPDSLKKKVPESVKTPAPPSRNSRN